MFFLSLWGALGLESISSLVKVNHLEYPETFCNFFLLVWQEEWLDEVPNCMQNRNNIQLASFIPKLFSNVILLQNYRPANFSALCFICALISLVR